MFKKTILFIGLMALFFNCANNTNGFTIKGTIDPSLDGKKVSLSKFEEGKSLEIDTTRIENGMFSLDGLVESTDVYLINIESARGNLPMILENKSYTINAYKDSLGLSPISGSLENDLAAEYMAALKAFGQESMALNQQMDEARKNKDTVFAKTFQEKRMDITKRSNDFTVEFVKTHNQSVFGLALMENLIARRQLLFDEAQSIFETYTDEAKKSGPGHRIKEEIDAIAATQIGAIAPDFSAMNPEGKDISLSDVKGKVTIIDFWAAWCGPCRKENPNMVKLYNTYHDNGLEIIGVGLDGHPRQKDAKGEWEEAIKKDSLSWAQVSNLQYFNGPIAKNYNIKSIPATFILDAEGKIVAKNLRGAQLEAKVAELLSE